MSSSRTAAATRARWANTTPEQRREGTRKARLQHAVNELVNQWPELTEAQQQKLRSLLRPIGGGPDA